MCIPKSLTAQGPSWPVTFILLLVSLLAAACASLPQPTAQTAQAFTATPATTAPGVIALPTPRADSGTSLEAVLLDRRSVRSFRDEPVALADLGQLLWAAQGITDPARGFRTAPSAGALYPLEIYVVAGKVEGLPAGVYRYNPGAHNLTLVTDGDQRDALYQAALRQAPIGQAPAVLVFAAIYERTTGKYGERGIRYVHLEAGHAAQNVLLQAVALGLGAVPIGAFDDDGVRQAAGMPAAEQPLYVVPVGKPQ